MAVVLLGTLVIWLPASRAEQANEQGVRAEAPGTTAGQAEVSEKPGVSSAVKDYDPLKNIVAIHDSSSRQYNKNCSECHQDVLNQGNGIDQAMSPYAAGRPGDNKQCRWCHRTVDLTNGVAQPAAKSKGNLRRHTDTQLCSLCHGPYRGGPGRQLYQSGISPTNPDGPALYELVCSACHGALASSQVRGKSASEIQHKIDEDEGGMGPLSVLTPAEIAAIAAALAQ